MMLDVIMMFGPNITNVVAHNMTAISYFKLYTFIFVDIKSICIYRRYRDINILQYPGTFGVKPRDVTMELKCVKISISTDMKVENEFIFGQTI